MALFHKFKVNFQQEINSAQNYDKQFKDSCKACSRRKKTVQGFGGEEIKYCETKNMAA